MKHISVITLHNVRNYGSALQTLATQEVFEMLGCKVDFINFVRDEQVSYKKRIKKWCKNYSPLKKMIYGPLLIPSFIKQDKIFKSFLKRRIHLQDKQYTTPEDFKTLPITADIYCTGSDQTWNSGWNEGIIGAMFLDFVPDNVKKIAYAASFGKEKLDEDEKDETRRLLKRYDAISVRERSGVDICKDLGINGAVNVLDPTIQLNRDFWLGIAGERKIKEPYILVYQLKATAEFDRFAKEYAKRKKMKLVRFCYRYYQMIRPGKSLMFPAIEDFASAIFYADTVITDSFHATAFSINMNTDFISIYPQEYSSRIDSILKLTHLEERHLQSFDDFSLADAPKIDFTETNRILEQEREKGWRFLRNAIK